MAQTLRLTKEEQRKTEIKCREINKILIDLEKKPIQESELLHIVLEKTLGKVKVNKRGEIEIE
ncbi:hypothetical protein [Shewanella algae]|uniref:hypothetical protein n=1 Tax=Shewanella algae TaxID=38313 RepID=UPI001AACA74E|nr:hypothetical protein [Shewanella algae]MBO2556780.1 hypothetical protein [Shewanella algae]MBO2556791.1 hypothetical protein [Shewanella algae]MBO2573714.1 hypothetical protein [Shewanella algae]MBO2573725.1 hypothetical protein [Shewanella algae]MBO2683545.1 hypothetical protein [Shewanella algae]